MKLKELRASRTLWRRRQKQAAAALKKAKATVKRRDRQIKAATTGPAAALRWARAQIGTTESPPGSNRGPTITAWQQALGSWLVGQPWCGVFVGTALHVAGVKVSSRVAAVVLILEDAIHGRNGFRSCVYRRSTGHGSVAAGRPGDVAGLFGESTHTALIEKRVPGGYQTLEGNTSSSNAGSQSNGGGVFRRVRPDSAVAYIVRPDYPKD